MASTLSNKEYERLCEFSAGLRKQAFEQGHPDPIVQYQIEVEKAYGTPLTKDDLYCIIGIAAIEHKQLMDKIDNLTRQKDLLIANLRDG